MPEIFDPDELLDLGPTAACEEVEEDLPDAARALRDGEDLAESHPALARHLEECERCRAILAELMREPQVLVEDEARARPAEVIARSMIAVLGEGEPIARARAAERLGGVERIGPKALAALGDAAAEDSDKEVRETALKALDRLDAAISIPQRLIEAWSEVPEEAAPFIEGVLARLAGDDPPTNQGITAAGKQGVTGRLSVEEGELRLKLEGLPSTFEKAKPVIALPSVLRAAAPRVDWFAKDPGLIPADTPVADGILNVNLGRVAEPAHVPALEPVYVLNPQSPGEKV
jgi:hypothetical protein